MVLVALMRVQAKEAPKARSSWHCTKVLPETVVEQAALASDGEFPKHNRARIASTIHPHDPRVSAMVLQPLSLPCLSPKASGLLHRNNLNIQATTQPIRNNENMDTPPLFSTRARPRGFESNSPKPHFFTAQATNAPRPSMGNITQNNTNWN
jgi:hypothetical protein